MTTDQPYITELRKLYELQPGLTREEFNNAKLVFARQSQEEQQVLLTGDNNEKLDYVRWLLERLQQPAIPPPPAPALQPAVCAWQYGHEFHEALVHGPHRMEHGRHGQVV